MINRHKWSQAQKQFIEENAEGISNICLTVKVNEKFGLSLRASQVKSFKRNHKISSGLDGRFKKGVIPKNKGLKWDEYLTKEQQNASRKTTFKKGSKPVCYLPVGSEILRCDGYVYIKIAHPKTWKQKHRIIWERAYGSIPEGHKIIFTDGDKDNFDLNNLALVTDRELLTMNRQKLIYKDPELTKTGIVLSKMINKIHEKEKK